MANEMAVPTAPPELDGKAASPDRRTPPPAALGYGVGLLLVAAATIAAFIVDHLIAAPNLTLVFVLPVVITATRFGWGPSLATAVAGVLAFDFFFTHPFYSFRISRPSDIWAAALLLVTAAIVSTVAGESRRRAVEAARAADQAQALQRLAHAVIGRAPGPVLFNAAADALGDIFDAPAVILSEKSGEISPAASSGRATLSAADKEAALWVLANNRPTRAESYPFDQAEFDFWPVSASAGQPLVLGVKLTGRAEGRPDLPDRHIELVAGYLAAARGAAASDGS